MRFALYAGFCTAAFLGGPSAWAQDPHASFHQMPTGNGYSFALYDGDAHKVSLFTEHPYRAYDGTHETRNLAYDAYFGVRAEAESHWLSDLPVTAQDYVDQSGVAHVTQGFGPVRAETYVFSPFGLHAPAVVLALRVTNTSGVALHNASAYSLLNFHLGSGVFARTAGGAPLPNADGEHVTWDPSHESLAETGASGLTLRYYALGHPTHHGAGGPGAPAPYAVGAAGGDLTDNSDSGVGTDVVPGLQWVLPDMAPGATAWVGVLVTLADDATAQTWLAGRTADTLVQAERDGWTAWRTTPPAGLSPVETRVWRQSEAVLRMGQCREDGPGNGAIVAAMPPGVWWIAWVRDMSYATVALARSGHRDEASRAVAFWAGAHVGTYQDMYVHTPYHVSVVRYFGNGTEESDTNENGPNIEFDGFGLATWAAHAAGHTEMDVNADTLHHLLAPNGMLSPDSSIWEVHWNGQQKQFAYSSITAARGLCEAGDAAGARALRDALVANAVLPTAGLGQSVEAVRTAGPGGAGARDAAVVEAINMGLIDPHGQLATRTLASFDFLKTPVGRGYFRNEDGGGYDSQEWVYIDLRISDALRRAGRTADADALLAWVTLQTDANLGLQAELYHRSNADYVGSIPMVGFGAGAYMLSVLDRTSPDTAPAGCFPATTAAGSMASTYVPPITDTVGSAGGMTCGVNPGGAPGGTSGGAGTPWAPMALGAVAALGARRRRRRSLAWLPAVMTLALLVGCGSTPATTPVTPDGSTGTDTGVTPGTDGGGAVDVPGTGTDSGGGVDGTVPPTDVGPLGGTLPVRTCTTSFVYNLGHGASMVAAAGEWNMFSTTANPMTDGLGTNIYRTAVNIPAGDYGYKFFADGTWSLDPGTGLTRYVGGVENSRLIVPDCNTPDLQVLSATATADGTVDLQIQYVDGGDRTGPDPAGFTVAFYPGMLPTGAVHFNATTGVGSIHLTGLAQTKYTFRIDARSHAGHAATQLVVPMWVEADPYEWGDGPMYFTFTDRFRNGNPLNDGRIGGVDPRVDYYGGDYAGILASLRDGYFDRLGVRVIWISPPNQNSHTPGLGSDGHHLFSGYHGYWPTQPRMVEPHWGTMDDLRALTAEAHRRGIRVLMDVVNNQLHHEHVYFAAHAHDGWFNGDGSCVCGGPGCDWDVHRLDCWFTSYLPDVNWTTMPTVDQMESDAMWWLVEGDLDGFRVDAVKHMQDIAHTTLRHRMAELEHGNTRYYTVGETFTGEDGRPLVSQYISDRELAAQFDFPLYWRIREAFAFNHGTMGDLENGVVASEMAYHGAVMSPFLGNHDVERFMTATAGNTTGNDQTDLWDSPPPAPDSDAPYDRLRLAFTFLLTQRGVPLIYYGDEYGQPGASDPDNRRPMRFGADLSTREARLLAVVQTLGHLRSTHPGLRRGARRSLYTDGDGYVYARGTSTEVALVALNRGSTSRAVMVPVPPELGVADGTVLRDNLGGPSVTVTGGSVMIPFNPVSTAVYTR